MSERIYCKDCKWFKKNEYNEKTGYCHMVPPMWLRNGINCKCFFAAVAIDDFCSKAEEKEDAKSEFYAIGKIEDGDAVYVIARDELEKMKEENNRLRKLIAEIREFFDWRGHYMGTTPLKSEYLMKIYTIANEEYEKRRAGK